MKDSSQKPRDQACRGPAGHGEHSVAVVMLNHEEEQRLIAEALRIAGLKTLQPESRKGDDDEKQRE